MKIELAVLVLACGLAAPAPAQWLKEPTRGIPRTADGKPNLTARRPSRPTASLISLASGASTRAPTAATWSWI